MADGVVLNTGTGGDTLDALNTTGSVKRQRVTQQVSTASLSNVSASATSVTLLSSNAARLGLIVVNDSTATLYLKYGTTASTTSYSVSLGPGETLLLEAVVFTGRIDAIWSVANGTARVTELSA